MKILSILAFVAILSTSCSSLDKFKTPEAANGGVPEGEKSSYLLNKASDNKPVEKTSTEKTTTTIKKKAVKKKTTK